MADSICCLSSSNSLRYSTSLLTSLNNLHPINLPLFNSCQRGFKFVDSSFVSLSFKPSKRISKANAAIAEATDQPKWWEKNAGPNMIDIHSTEEFLSALKEAGDRLVVAEFFGTWCASCRALFPRLCRMAVENPEILFLKVDFDANKQLCKSMNVKVLPYFHFYHGADGKVEEFSCSLAKFQRIREAIEKHNSAPIMAKVGNDVAVNSDDEPAKSSNT